MPGTTPLPFLGLLAQSPRAEESPWLTNAPIVSVTKEVYLPAPGPWAAAYLWVTYLGPGRVIEEVLTEERKSDQFEKPRRRRSMDNGRTWSEWAPAEDLQPYAKDDFLFWAPSYPSFFYDRRGKVTLAMWLRQQVVEGRYYNHTFVREFRDGGPDSAARNAAPPHGTWGEPLMLRYEAGDELDPQDPLKPGFLHSNGAYFGQKIIRLRNGTLAFPVCGVRIPADAPDPNPQGVSVWDTPADSRNIGSLCFVGRPSRLKPLVQRQGGYEWTAGKPVWLPRHVSSRGLMEPDVAELKDGRLLLIWRGSNAGLDPASQPGHKWFSVSEDGGLTLSPPQELRYDDGSSFYSPSSYHLLIRHSRNRKLYWVGNISPTPTAGNEPRYPLVIAEVDEAISETGDRHHFPPGTVLPTGSVGENGCLSPVSAPTLNKRTVTVIDDRGPNDPAHLSLSNFSLLENRETHDFELYMTRVGDAQGDCVYQYTLHLK
jgi:hypothetical protein